ncbi:hypothetical protein M3Y98_00030500 [Aphelenchoides besseyi]|nr:hypothetical protein M3Y98_00030500 [Aphelenchoides besseyi]KAI6199342.1 hypothetical protein M3Y96_00616900 [Aphelenchoides besseyi]
MSNDELTLLLDAHDFYSMDDKSLFKFIDANDFSEAVSSFLVDLFEMANETTTSNNNDEHYSSEHSDHEVGQDKEIDQAQIEAHFRLPDGLQNIENIRESSIICKS